MSVPALRAHDRSPGDGIDVTSCQHAMFDLRLLGLACAGLLPLASQMPERSPRGDGGAVLEDTLAIRFVDEPGRNLALAWERLGGGFPDRACEELRQAAAWLADRADGARAESRAVLENAAERLLRLALGIEERQIEAGHAARRALGLTEHALACYELLGARAAQAAGEARAAGQSLVAAAFHVDHALAWAGRGAGPDELASIVRAAELGEALRSGEPVPGDEIERALADLAEQAARLPALLDEESAPLPDRGPDAGVDREWLLVRRESRARFVPDSVLHADLARAGLARGDSFGAASDLRRIATRLRDELAFAGGGSAAELRGAAADIDALVEEITSGAASDPRWVDWASARAEVALAQNSWRQATQACARGDRRGASLELARALPHAQAALERLALSSDAELLSGLVRARGVVAELRNGAALDALDPSLLDSPIDRLRLAARVLSEALRGGPLPAAAPALDLARAERLFERECALCHGTSGAGDGPAAVFTFPRPRDFTRGEFKVVSTRNGAPTDSDLIEVLRRGIPGSAMPSWAWLPREDLAGLADYVRLLAVEGLVERWSDAGDEAPAGELWERAEARLAPGPPVDVPPPAEADAATLARGEELFRASCASCHGVDGRGLPEVVRRDPDESRNFARDFTAGVLKGGATHADLVRRIRVGIHGTAMPGNELSGAELADIVAYTKSLIPPGAEDRLVQRRERITARRVAAPAPRDPGDPLWTQEHGTELVLSPLWWRDDAVTRVVVEAVHDGESLCLLVRWTDATRDSAQGGASPYADGVALQFASTREAPPYGMSSLGDRVNLWHWNAQDLPLERGLAWTLRSLLIHRLGRGTPEELAAGLLYQAGRSPDGVLGEAVATTPAGLRRREEQRELASTVEARPRWRDGAWEVLFTRRLEPRSERELALSPGTEHALCCAAWNGAAHDVRGQKSVTMWHVLELAP